MRYVGVNDVDGTKYFYLKGSGLSGACVSTTKTAMVVVTYNGDEKEGAGPGDCNEACESLVDNLAKKGYWSKRIPFILVWILFKITKILFYYF